MSEKNIQEKKKLSLFDVFSLGFGGAVGSGIFVLMGSGIASTGKSIVLVVGIGVFFMLLAYFYNFLLPSMFVFEGGDYSQKAIAFTPLFTGIAAYLTFINGAGVAMYAVAMVKYASVIFPGILPYSQALSVAIITLFFAATIKGSKFVSLLNNFMTIVLLGSIIAFIVFGVPKVQAGYFQGNDFFLNGFPGFIAAISIMGWACQGTTMGPVSVASIVKNSKRTLPLGILVVCVALAVVYALMSYVAAGVLPIEQVAGQTLSVVAESVFPRSIYVIFILGGAVFAIGTSMITGIQMVRYPILKVAQDGWLPEFCAKTTKSGYPWVVYLIFYVISVVPILTNFDLDAIVSLVMIPAMIMNVYLNLACIKIVKQYPEQWKKSMLHMPMWLITILCVASAICAAIVCYNLFMLFSPQQMMVMVGIMVFVTALAWIRIKQGKVSVETLERNKQLIIEKALAADEE